MLILGPAVATEHAAHDRAAHDGRGARGRGHGGRGPGGHAGRARPRLHALTHRAVIVSHDSYIGISGEKGKIKFN